jgi:hypothetical protein
MGDYGKKGGTSATSGRKAETIVGKASDGAEYRKRVFFGQRALVVTKDSVLPSFSPLVTAWADLPTAEAHADKVRNSFPSYSSVEAIAAAPQESAQ